MGGGLVFIWSYKSNHHLSKNQAASCTDVKQLWRTGNEEVSWSQIPYKDILTAAKEQTVSTYMLYQRGNMSEALKWEFVCACVCTCVRVCVHFCVWTELSTWANCIRTANRASSYEPPLVTECHTPTAHTESKWHQTGSEWQIAQAKVPTMSFIKKLFASESEAELLF